MDSNAPENADSKAEFQKPFKDAANRKYRRRSPVCGSSSSDGSPQRDKGSKPVPSRKVTSDEKRKKDESGVLDRDYRRSQSGRSGESYKHSDRRSSRSYHRYDDHKRHDGCSDDYDRNYSKSTHRFGRESRGHTNSDYSRGNKGHQFRDYSEDVDKYTRERTDGFGHRGRENDIPDGAGAGSGRRHDDMKERNRNTDRLRNRENRGGRDEKRDHKSSGDHKSKFSPAHDEARVHVDELSSQKDSSELHLKEASLRDSKGLDDAKYINDENRRHDDQGRYKDEPNRETEEQSDDTKTIPGVDQDSIPKKPKLSSINSTGLGTNGTATAEQSVLKDSDIDAAKIAAIKAAELVNKNLIGTRYMSTDQKKKLLWGSKKSTSTEESAHRWDTSTFGDRERQEKFNKLMGVKGESKVEHKQDIPDVEKQREQLQLELEKQYTAGLRRRDGRTVGLGL